MVLRYGGLYADIDTECGMNLEDILQPEDGFVAGWEQEFPTQDMAIGYKFARQRQILQWVFAASPGHPLLQVTPVMSTQNVPDAKPIICQAYTVRILWPSQGTLQTLLLAP